MPLQGDEYVISTAAEWAAVSSPVRFEILEFMRMLTPCSLAELGQAMARPSDGLYHHVKVMLKAGIVVPAGDRELRGASSPGSARRGRGGGVGGEVAVGGGGRRAGGRREALFALASTRFRFDIDPATGRNIRAVKKLIAGLCRLSHRAISHAFDAGLPLGVGPGKQIWARSETAWLDDAALAEVNAHILAIDAVFERGRRVRSGKLFQISYYMNPVVRQPRRSAVRASDSAVRRKSKGTRPWIVPTA